MLREKFISGKPTAPCIVLPLPCYFKKKNNIFPRKTIFPPPGNAHAPLIYPQISYHPRIIHPEFRPFILYIMDIYG